MKYDSIPGLTLPKIGFGTWGIGGGTSADPGKDAVSLTALRTALEVGYTHFDTAETYAGGHSEELLGRAVRESGVQRDALFITSKVKPSHLKYEQVLSACESSLPGRNKYPPIASWISASSVRGNVRCSVD